MWQKNRGVSPVIAVILMVAITVILASVVATYVLTIGNSVSEPPPNAVFEFEQEYGTYPPGAAGGGNPMTDKYYRVNVIYKAGPTIDLNNINITMNAGPEDWQTGQALWFSPDDGGFNLPFRTDAERSSKTHIKAGEESGPLLAPYDPQKPVGHNPTMKQLVTDDDVEQYGSGGPVVKNDFGKQHSEHKLANPGTTIRVVWTGGSQKQVLAEYTVQEA